MKKLFHQSKYFKIEYDPKANILLCWWEPDMVHISELEFKNELLKVTEAVKEYRPKAIFFDSTKAFYPLTDEINQWILENITKVIVENGVKKISYALPMEVFTRIGLQMFVEQSIATFPNFLRKFFPTVEEAIQWAKE